MPLASKWSPLNAMGTKPSAMRSGLIQASKVRSPRRFVAGPCGTASESAPASCTAPPKWPSAVQNGPLAVPAASEMSTGASAKRRRRNW